MIHGSLSQPELTQATRRLTKLLPQAKVHTINDAGHAIHYDQPDAFVAAVKQALVRHEILA